MKVKVISLLYIFQVLYVLCFTRPRYQVSVYRTIGPLVTFQHALFVNTRKLPANASICSTERSDISSPSEVHHRVQQSRLPTEPWQVTKKHLNLSPEEIASLGSGEPGHTSEDMNAKVLKVSHGRKKQAKSDCIGVITYGP